MEKILKDDPCLICRLDDCNETHPDCYLKSTLNNSRRKWYIKLKRDPKRHEGYKRKKREIKKKWLQTPEGKVLWNAQIKRYRKKHPEKVKAIGRAYHKRNKEKRLAQHREYMRKRRLNLTNRLSKLEKAEHVS